MATLFDAPLKECEKTGGFLQGLNKHIHESWTSLKSFSKESLYEILRQVIERGSQTKIYPNAGLMFRAFKECALFQARVIFVGQDPYHQPGVADGLAFSCGVTKREQPSLKFILNEIQRTVYPGMSYNRDTDLVRWANQGVLLLNTALTVDAGKPDSHTEIWRPWIQGLLKDLNECKQDSIFIFVGTKARAFQHLVTKHHKLFVVHPASAAHRGGLWDCGDVFNDINKILLEQGKKKIIW